MLFPNEVTANPSQSGALFPAIIEFFSVSGPSRCRMPPLSKAAALPLTVLFVSVASPEFEIPPPAPSAVLPLTVLFVSVSVPRLKMPPPLLVVSPLVIVTLESSSVVKPRT